jgi:hypothetical protein
MKRECVSIFFKSGKGKGASDISSAGTFNLDDTRTKVS